MQSLEGSWDFNLKQQMPSPVLPDDQHGTRCAGEIAASRNTVCGIGVAFEAKVSGSRILSGPITDADEAGAVLHANQINDIYSCSWGPEDDGQTVLAPNPLVLDAFRHGVETGRGGLGSIFVFATGNGGGNHDNCNFDGYTNNVWSISVGAIDRYHHKPFYSEDCSAQLCVTYSSGNGDGIVWHMYHFAYIVCRPRPICIAAAPARIQAHQQRPPLLLGSLPLRYRQSEIITILTLITYSPALSWRDMQHIIVQTAIPIDIEDSDWSATGGGFRFNHKYGFGKLDAYRIVELAKGWHRRQSLTSFSTERKLVDADIPERTEGLRVPFHVARPVDFSYLERVTVTVSLSHACRGDLSYVLVSPFGSQSTLATARPKDVSAAGLTNWTFVTVKHWGEEVAGEWQLLVTDTNANGKVGRVLDASIHFYGEQTGNGTTIFGPNGTSPHRAYVNGEGSPQFSTVAYLELSLIAGLSLSVLAGMLVFMYTKLFQKNRTAYTPLSSV